MSKAEADFEVAQQKINNLSLDEAKTGSRGGGLDSKDDGASGTDRFAMMVNKSKAAGGGDGDALGRSMRDDLSRSARGAIMKGLDYLGMSKHGGGGLGASRHGSLEPATEKATTGDKSFK